MNIFGSTARRVAAAIFMSALTAAATLIGQEGQRTYPSARTGGNYS